MVILYGSGKHDKGRSFTIKSRKMNDNRSVYSESVAYAFFKTFLVPCLRPAFFNCIYSIFKSFFFRQFRAAMLPGRVPVSRVDHHLDAKIPFVPSWVTIYLDFTTFWIRILSFMLRRWKRDSYAVVKDFIHSIIRLYLFASQVYTKNFSTTNRPFYIARPRFFLIHLVDPHLMCVPSLHVMVVINTYTKFAAIVRSMGEEEKLNRQTAEIKNGALAITQAILFVKQHSVNCIAASLYAMTCFDPEAFPLQEAEAFTSLLFTETAQDNELKLPANCRVHPSAAPGTRLPQEVQAEIKAHILNLYRRFLYEKPQAKIWNEPLLNFMRSLPQGY